MEMFFGPGLAVISLFAAVVLVVRAVLANRHLMRESEVRLQLHTRLIEKFGTSPELVEYLRSDAGRAFLTPPPAEKAAPYRRILGSAQAGIVLAFVGGAIWALRGGDPHQAERAAFAMSVFGGIILALGLGFLASSALAYVLSARWGLFNGKTGPAEEVQ
jgi:hypothetical protein